MAHPKDRTEEQVQTVVDHWLEHGELSIVAKRTVAQNRNRRSYRKDGGVRGPTAFKPGRAAAAMQPDTNPKTAWGREPAGGWAPSQTKTWEREQQAEQASSKSMEERAQKAVGEF